MVLNCGNIQTINRKTEDKTMCELQAYGKSMYGGWYANVWKNGEIRSIHADTQIELRMELSVVFKITTLENWKRYDN